MQILREDSSKNVLQAVRNSCRKEEETVKKAIRVSTQDHTYTNRRGAVMTARRIAWLALLALPLLVPVASADDSGQRPSYYSEDYAGPQGPQQETSKVAYIRVRVPANAELWINNDKRAQRGAVREFVTPALDPDSIYVYNVKARWTDEGGIEVQKTLRVRTIAGTRVTVNFVRPPESQPRPVAPAPTPRSAPVVTVRPTIQQPVSWTSGSVAPRSFRGAGAP